MLCLDTVFIYLIKSSHLSEPQIPHVSKEGAGLSDLNIVSIDNLWALSISYLVVLRHFSLIGKLPHSSLNIELYLQRPALA